MTQRLVALAVAAVLVAAACGGDDADSSSPVPHPDDSDSTDTNGGDDDADATETTAAGTSQAYSGATMPGDDITGKPEVVLPSQAPTGLIVTDLVEGTGDPLEAGDTLVAHYVGVRSADGTEFDESYSSGQPIEFTVGVARVIPGWDQGLLGIKTGGRRQLDIPASLAYGEAGAGDIIGPGDALTFVVDAVAVMKPPPPPTLARLADPADCPAPDGSSEKQQEFAEYPPTCIDVTKTYTAEIVTNHGPLTVELDAEQAPVTVNSFVVLARYHYFDDTVCHRAIPQFVVQCGDPTGTGTGGPGYQFNDELPEAGEYQIGSVAMANSGANTNGSQFFLITGPNGAALPPQYSLFGQVTDGLDDTLPALDALGNDDPASNGVPPLEPIIIESVTITES